MSMSQSTGHWSLRVLYLFVVFECMISNQKANKSYAACVKPTKNLVTCSVIMEKYVKPKAMKSFPRMY